RGLLACEALKLCFGLSNWNMPAHLPHQRQAVIRPEETIWSIAETLANRGGRGARAGGIERRQPPGVGGDEHRGGAGCKCKCPGRKSSPTIYDQRENSRQHRAGGQSVIDRPQGVARMPCT